MFSLSSRNTNQRVHVTLDLPSYLDGVMVGVTVPVARMGVLVAVLVHVGMGVDVGSGVSVHDCPTKPGVGVSNVPSMGYPSEYHLWRPPSNIRTRVKPSSYRYIAAAGLVGSPGDRS